MQSSRSEYVSMNYFLCDIKQFILEGARTQRSKPNGASSSLHPALFITALFTLTTILPVCFSTRRASRRTEITSLTHSARSMLSAVKNNAGGQCRVPSVETSHVSKFSKTDSEIEVCTQVHPGSFIYLF